MAERVRICDIAEELGLSTATVSNVIHGKTGKVSAEPAERVTALLEEREYIRSMAAGRRAARRARRGEAARAQRRPPRRDGDHAARFAGGAKQHRAAQRIILHKRGAFILYSVMRLTFASPFPGNYNKEEKREVRYERTKRFL